MALVSEVAVLLTGILKRSGDKAAFPASPLPSNAEFRGTGAGEQERAPQSC